MKDCIQHVVALTKNAIVSPDICTLSCPVLSCHVMSCPSML